MFFRGFINEGYSLFKTTRDRMVNMRELKAALRKAGKSYREEEEYYVKYIITEYEEVAVLKG
jgi:hypothetical protein